MKLEVVDRHGEHVDPRVPLCEHETMEIRPGDEALVTVSMEMAEWMFASRLVEARAEVRVQFLSRDRIRLVIDHADFLAAKRATDG